MILVIIVYCDSANINFHSVRTHQTNQKYTWMPRVSRSMCSSNSFIVTQYMVIGGTSNYTDSTLLYRLSLVMREVLKFSIAHAQQCSQFSLLFSFSSQGAFFSLSVAYSRVMRVKIQPGQCKNKRETIETRKRRECGTERKKKLRRRSCMCRYLNSRQVVRNALVSFLLPACPQRAAFSKSCLVSLFSNSLVLRFFLPL